MFSHLTCCNIMAFGPPAKSPCTLEKFEVFGPTRFCCDSDDVSEARFAATPPDGNSLLSETLHQAHIKSSQMAMKQVQRKTTWNELCRR